MKNHLFHLVQSRSQNIHFLSVYIVVVLLFVLGGTFIAARSITRKALSPLETLDLEQASVQQDVYPELRPIVERFAQQLREAARTAEEPKKPSVMGGVSWKMDEAAFEDGQYLAYRTLYYRYRFLRPATFIRLAVSVAAVINLMNKLTPLNVAVSAVILLLANLENISMVPFISRLRIRREVGAWKGGSEYRLALRDDTLLFSSDRAQAQIPVHKLNLCEEIGPYCVMAWSNFPAVVIPLEAARTPELSALIGQVRESFQTP